MHCSILQYMCDSRTFFTLLIESLASRYSVFQSISLASLKLLLNNLLIFIYNYFTIIIYWSSITFEPLVAKIFSFIITFPKPRKYLSFILAQNNFNRIKLQSWSKYIWQIPSRWPITCTFENFWTLATNPSTSWDNNIYILTHFW